MKFTKKDIVNILWEFGQLESDIVDDRLVTDISVSNPDPKNTLLAFRFSKVWYFALFDEQNEDVGKVTDEIKKAFPNIEFTVLESPKTGLVAIPFKGKEMYLARGVDSKKRLDIWMSENCDGLNRSMAAKLVKDGRVKVNGSCDVKASQMVGDEDKIEVDIPGKQREKVDLNVLYKDNDVVVLDKPAGMLTHAKGNFEDEFTVSDFVDDEMGDSDLEKDDRTGIVHRLDRDTSGVLIAALNSEAKSKLMRQFSDRKARKTYFAVVEGRPKLDKALIDLPIARNQKRPTTFRVDSNGRPAETFYEVVKSNGKYSLLKLTPKTGRTHQLRVHLGYVGVPIVGDRVYGKEADRMYLHASELEITLPNSERKVFESAVPESFYEKVS